MGELLTFGAMELGFSGFTEDLGERPLDLGRREGDGQVLELIMVHGHDNEPEIFEPAAGDFIEIRLCKHFSQLDFPLAPAAAENHSVVIGNFTDRRIVFGQKHGFQMVIVLTQLISLLTEEAS